MLVTLTADEQSHGLNWYQTRKCQFQMLPKNHRTKLSKLKTKLHQKVIEAKNLSPFVRRFLLLLYFGAIDYVSTT